MGKKAIEPTCENSEIYYPESKVLVSFEHPDGKADILVPDGHGVANRYPFAIGVSFNRKYFEIYRSILTAKTFSINVPDTRHADIVKKCEELMDRPGDKYEALGLLKRKALRLGSPMIDDCTVSAEFRVRQLWNFGKYDFIVGEFLMGYNDLDADLDKTIMAWKGPNQQGAFTVIDV